MDDHNEENGFIVAGWKRDPDFERSFPGISEKRINPDGPKVYVRNKIYEQVCNLIVECLYETVTLPGCRNFPIGSTNQAGGVVNIRIFRQEQADSIHQVLLTAFAVIAMCQSGVSQFRHSSLDHVVRQRVRGMDFPAR